VGVVWGAEFQKIDKKWTENSQNHPKDDFLWLFLVLQFDISDSGVSQIKETSS
jgi:hypothetical protein